MTRKLFASTLVLSMAAPGWCHVGSPNVFFEGSAGPIPLRVTVRPPGAIPGLAEITVRVTGASKSGAVKRVSVLPVHWRAGREGSPPPDEAVPVRGEPDLYSASLWLMDRGAYSVHVTVEAEGASGTAIVPVNAVATTRLPLAPWFGALLLGLSSLLFLLAVAIAAGAAREGALPPGEAPGHGRLWRSWAVGAATALWLWLCLLGGKRWWDEVDSEYRNNTLYRPSPVAAAARAEGSQIVLRLSVSEEGNRQGWTPLITDHGKLMHLFLVREPGLDALAHLHPLRRKEKTFEAAVPPLPAGTYRLYADVTHENGFAETLTAAVELPPPPAAADTAFLAPDPDDSFFIGAPLEPLPALGRGKQDQAGPGVERCSLEGGLTMVWERPAPLHANREAALSFRVLDAAGRPAALEPYMGMLGHAAVRRDDGAVFAHLHPVGTISMASQDLFARREGERAGSGAAAGGKAGAPGVSGAAPGAGRGSGQEEVEHMEHEGHAMAAGSETGPDRAVSFPYEFPRPGRYRIWVQIKSGGKVLTGSFTAAVAEE